MTTRLQPDLFGLVEAAAVLCAEGFEVLPYTTEDLSAAERLVAAGCTVLMPWAAPIGSARGLINKTALQTLRAYFPDTPLIIDAGIGTPSHAAEAMEMGYDAVLLNTAIAKAGDPVKMAASLRQGDRGRAARLRGGPRRAARHGLAVDAGGRHALLQDRSRLLTAVCLRCDLIHLDPFYPIVPDTDWLARLAAARRQAGAAPHQGPARERRPRRDRQGDGALRRAMTASSWSTTIGARRSTPARASCISARRTWRPPTSPPSGPRGMKIGISTHSHEELDTALAADADYVALGPDLRHHAEDNALGAARSARASPRGAKAVKCPLVAIGGITARTGADRARRRRRQRRCHHRHCDKPRP